MRDFVMEYGAFIVIAIAIVLVIAIISTSSVIVFSEMVKFAVACVENGGQMIKDQCVK